MNDYRYTAPEVLPMYEGPMRRWFQWRRLLLVAVAVSPPWLIILKIVWDELLQPDDTVPTQPTVIEPAPDGRGWVAYPGGGANPA